MNLTFHYGKSTLYALILRRGDNQVLIGAIDSAHYSHDGQRLFFCMSFVCDSREGVQSSAQEEQQS